MTVTGKDAPANGIAVTYSVNTGIRDVVNPTRTIDAAGAIFPYTPYQPYDPIGPGLLPIYPVTSYTYTPPQKFRTHACEDTLIATVDIPGVTKESLLVRMNGYTLIVTGKRRDGQPVCESVSIDQQWDVRHEKIGGLYQDGVLEVYFAKNPDAPQEIKIGYSG